MTSAWRIERTRRRSRRVYPNSTAPEGEVKRITALLMDALSASGYVKPRAAASTEEKVGRLVLRLRIGPGDAELLLGMLR